MADTIAPKATEPTTEPAVLPTADTAAAETKPMTTEAAPAAATSAIPPEELPKEEKVGDKEVKITAQPIAAGNLGYKAPGLMKQFRFVTKYFWFGDAALDEASLSSYVKAEKPETAHHNAAYASQTGKGLFLFAKREDDKGAPTGILHLADATDLSKDGTNDFSFKLHGHKHAFQANSSNERDSWIVSVQKAIDESAPMKEGIVGSEGYKSQHDKYSKPAAAATGGAAAGAAAGATSTKSATTSHKDKVHDGTSEAETGTSAKVEAAPKSEKSRSQSRKRASIFGKVLGKKEETDEHKEIKKDEKKADKDIKEADKEEKKAEKEEKKEEKAAVKAEEKKEHKEEKKVEKEEKKEEKKIEKEEKKEEKEEKKEEKKAEKAAEKQHKEEEAAAVAASAAAAPPATEESKNTEAKDTKGTKEATSPTTDHTPAKAKRSSIFGGLGMFGKKDKDTPAAKKEEPAAPTTETAPVADTPPQLDPVDTAVPSDTAPSAIPATTEPAPTSATSSSPKAEKTESKGGLRGLFRPKESEAKKDEVPKTESVAAKPIEPTTESTSAVADSPVATAPTTKTPESGDLKDRRRSSFFGTITGRKGKSAEPKDRKVEPTSETEAADGKKESKIQGLFRKASKSAKPHSGPAKDSTAPPVPAKEAETKAVDDTVAPTAVEGAAPTSTTKADPPATATADPLTTTTVDQPATTEPTVATGATETKTEGVAGETAGSSAPATTTAPVAASA